jgi:hypothetical protein
MLQLPLEDAAPLPGDSWPHEHMNVLDVCRNIPHPGPSQAQPPPSPAWRATVRQLCLALQHLGTPDPSHPGSLPPQSGTSLLVDGTQGLDMLGSPEPPAVGRGPPTAPQDMVDQVCSRPTYIVMRLSMVALKLHLICRAVFLNRVVEVCQIMHGTIAIIQSLLA